jgi:HEAT repeat protein
VTEVPLTPLRIGSYVAPVIPDILEEHLEEVAFLSIQRRKLLFSDYVPLRQVLLHDKRVAAHWAALELGGQASVQVALKRLNAFDPWETYAAIRVWLELGDPGQDEVTGRIDEAEEEHLPAWREALRRMEKARLNDLFPPDQPRPGSVRTQSLLAFAWGWHGLLLDDVASSLAFSSDPGVRWSVARVLGVGGMSPMGRKLLPPLYSDPEISVQRAALWSLVQMDPNAAVAAARSKLYSEEPDAFAARVLGLLGGPEDAELLRRLAGEGEVGVASVRALGDLGYLDAMDLLLEALSEGEGDLAAAASDAIEALLSDLPSLPEREEDRGNAGDDGPSPGEASTRAPEGTGSPATDDDEPPQAELVKKAWLEMAPEYGQADRWLRGKPFPWQGAPEDEPMEATWRIGLSNPAATPSWLRQEVPDGFFSACAALEAIPGE